MHRYLLALALVLLLAADLGWKAWSERPYIVTGYGVVAVGDGRAATVQYRLPGGGTGEWRVLVTSTGGSAGVVETCALRARIGSNIPDCMRSLNEIKNGR